MRSRPPLSVSVSLLMGAVAVSTVMVMNPLMEARPAEPAGPLHPDAGGKTASGGAESPTFTRDVAPIIFNQCGSCHHRGGSAPFSLLTYKEAKKRAKQIAMVTAKRYMPPWLPEPGYGEFEGTRRLSDAQVATLGRWAERGSPEGNRADLPPIPMFNDGWQLGTPDMILRTPRPFTLQAGGPDVFHNFAFPVPVTSPHFVRAVEILPGNTKVVHHANVLVDRYGSALELDEQDADVGFAGMKVKLESKRFEPQTHFLFWKPGTAPAADPADMAWPLDKGTVLVLNMHLRPSGKPERIQPTIGLYFSDTPPTKFPMLLQLEHDGALDVPPGKKDFVVTDDFELPLDVDLLGVYPHAHYLGKEFQGVVTLPGGENRPLIWIKNWDLDWQAVYRNAAPMFLPKGTTISMRWTYDNSEGNERNPNHPPRRVMAGNKSSDEMSHLWIQVLPRREEDRKILQEALVRQKLRKYPRDFDSHLSLGAVLQSMGKLQEAIVSYRRAVGIKPGEPLAENNLGAALLSTGLSAAKLDEAIAHFRQAVKNRPDYVDAQYNLGNALLARGDVEEAASHFLLILESEPDDTDAHDHLGSAYIMQGKLTEAAEQFASALQVDPDHPSAHYNLGFIYARNGDLTRATDHLERSLKIRPGDANAHNVLGVVYGRQGRLTEAITEFESALRLDPAIADARDSLERARGGLATALPLR